MQNPDFIPPISQDVLVTEREQIRRMADLYKAAAMYNFTGSRVELTVLLGEEQVQIDIAVMAAGTHTVMCSEGMTIPVKTIFGVAF
jgi:hypothetical protein